MIPNQHAGGGGGRSSVSSHNGPAGLGAEAGLIAAQALIGAGLHVRIDVVHGVDLPV